MWGEPWAYMRYAGIVSRYVWLWWPTKKALFVILYGPIYSIFDAYEAFRCLDGETRCTHDNNDITASSLPLVYEETILWKETICSRVSDMQLFLIYYTVGRVLIVSIY